MATNPFLSLLVRPPLSDNQPVVRPGNSTHHQKLQEFSAAVKHENLGSVKLSILLCQCTKDQKSF